MSQALFQRWLDGDRGAFEQLYQIYHPRIRSFATALIGHSTEGEDLAQETFLRLYQAKNSFNGRAFRMVVL